ncbi:uncharacterized membrane protein [Bacillus oleivorans]|uniref:Uncharacterized membrane protein n=1 Tax=Bacillus oleivorans TaxID=1448271 RepID=A0A285CJ42_9BACI|nr:DMT family transporter [Bacillus oleivorans]SNX67028.1 uncharacterized membrane protein [Bacillus oleivorans]
MGIALAFLSGLSFALGNIVAKIALDQSAIRYSLWITSFVNFAVFGLIDMVYRLVVSKPAPINFAGLLFFLVAGLLTTYLGRKTLYISFQYIGPSRGSAIKNSSPIFTLLVALFIFDETISFYSAIGVAIVLAGILLQAVILFQENGKAESAVWHGYLVAVICAICFGVGLAVRGPGMEHIPDPYFGAFMSGVVTFFFASVEEVCRYGVRDFFSFLRNCLKRENWLFYVAGLCTSIGVGTFFLALQFLEVSLVSTIAAIDPILTILLSVIILKRAENITRWTVLSAIVVLLGVAFIMMGE